MRLTRYYFLAFLLSVCAFASAQDVPKGLPVVYISTADGSPVTGRQWRQGTRVRICRADGSTDYDSADAAVKAHGNSSFQKPKKPLTLKLGSPVSVLGMTANTKWFFVSNFMDHSLLRNSLALTAAKLTSMAWTSDWRLVNVVENGKYIGCYLIGEEIHVGKHWVDADPATGFLVELDAYPGDEYRLATAHRQLPVNVRFPKEPTRERMDSIKKVLDDIEAVLYKGGAKDYAALYRSRLNLDSFVDYLIIYELCQNAEPNGPRSCYMYLGRDGKLCAGPVWDFDLAFEDMGLDSGGDIRPSRFGSEGVRRLTVDSLYNSRALWYGQLLKDPVFCRRLAERWTALRPRFASLADSLDRWRQAIAPSATADQQMWGRLDPARFDNTGSFEASVANLRATFLRRIEALDRLFAYGGRH